MSNGTNKTPHRFTCFSCKKVITIHLDAEDLVRYRQGQLLIQNVFHYLSSDEREMLLTQTCGVCRDGMFAKESQGVRLKDDTSYEVPITDEDQT